MKKIKDFLLMDVKNINKYLLVISILLLLTVVGASSYALFTYETYSPNGIHVVYNPMPKCTISESPVGEASSKTLTIVGNSEVIANGYSWDGTTYSSTITKTINKNGTYTAYVKDSSNNVKTCSIEISDILEIPTILSKYESGDLHIGDFITYDAGTWTAEEIASIQVGPNSSLVAANKSTSLPTSNYQFGGFTTGQSRNAGAIEYNNGTYMYAKMYDGNDSSNQVPISGWRIFDIDNNYVTLISAANPEDYKHPNVTYSSYISQYILTGIKDNRWKGTPSDYTIRNWSMYENSVYNASNARILTKTDLDNWYNKYMGVTSATTSTQSTFQRIYSSPYLAYQNLIDNHSFYWLGSADDDSNLFDVYPSFRFVVYDFDDAFGVRVLVSIPLTSTIQENPVARRTVTLDGMTYSGGTYGPESVQEYNVWDLAVE